MPTYHYFATESSLLVFSWLLIVCSTSIAQPTAEETAIQVVSREEFFPSKPGILVNAQSFYAKDTGFEKIRFRGEQNASDKANSLEMSRSDDNGKTWSTPDEMWVVKKTPEGIVRRVIKAGWIDPESGGLLIMHRTIIGETDHVLQRFGRGSTTAYTITRDGWRTELVNEPVLLANATLREDGLFHDKRYPESSIFSMMYGDRTGRPVRNHLGEILQPVQLVLFEPDGKKLYNPGKGYTFTQAALLIGKLRDDHRIDWSLSQRVELGPDRSTRGSIEPTIAKLDDGRILMVVRGSNDRNPKLPGYKWFSVSNDGGHSWSKLKPWTYNNGENFFSPSSCSQFLTHSNGNIYWLGNISPKNPNGNLPRWPFVIGQVDFKTGLLMERTVVTVDEPKNGDHPRMMLSNFMAHEDRETKEILLHMSRTFAKGPGNWTSPAYLYRIAVGK